MKNQNFTSGTACDRGDYHFFKLATLKHEGIIKIQVNLTELVEPEAIPQPKTNYLFKYFWNPEGRSGTFDYHPRLIKQSNEIDWGTVDLGKGELMLACRIKI